MCQVFKDQPYHLSVVSVYRRPVMKAPESIKTDKDNSAAVYAAGFPDGAQSFDIGLKIETE